MRAILGKKLLDGYFFPVKFIEIDKPANLAKQLETDPDNGYIIFRTRDVLKLLAKQSKNNSK